MKIVIVAPLFPPEIGGSARYAKDLASRLAPHHEVTAVAFASHPEEVSGAIIRGVSKRRPRALRMISLVHAVLHTSRKSEVLYVLNGRSTELVALGMWYLFRKPFILSLADSRADQSERGQLLGRLARHAAQSIVQSVPMDRPEIIPLDPYPQQAFDAYEAAWKEHLTQLETVFASKI